MKALLLLAAGLGGLVQAVAPRRAVALWTRAMYRNAGAAEPREWVYAAAKLEGAVVAAASLVGLYKLATADDEDRSDERADADSAAASDEAASAVAA